MFLDPLPDAESGEVGLEITDIEGIWWKKRQRVSDRNHRDVGEKEDENSMRRTALALNGERAHESAGILNEKNTHKI